MPRNIASRLETKAVLLKELIDDIKSGEIKIPKFQRKFVWRAAQALDLLDSISNNYPIGSLLLWKTHTKLIAERDIGDFRLPETDDTEPTDYVLDGQQRLTVIYSCLGAERTDDGFAAGYDLDQSIFAELPDAPPLTILPLRILYQTTALLDFRTALRTHPNADDLQRRVDALIGVITSYRLPVVILKELTVEEVCPIFERINSSGTRLSTYDLMVAATWSEDFDLDDEAVGIAASLEPKGFGDVDKTSVLKCLSAIHSASIKRGDILELRNLNRASMNDLVALASQSLLRVVDLLSTEFRIYSWDFLPYEALLLVLAVIYADRSSLDSDEITRVRQWFWRSAFNERYRGASENFISRDLSAVTNFVINDEVAAEEFGEPPTAAALRRATFRANNSRSRAFMLGLASCHPRNMTNGATIDVTEALSSFNRKQFHHIYPRAYLKRNSIPGEPNSLANICMLSASENVRIGDADPPVYIPQCVETLGADAEGVFASNLLPNPGSTDWRDLDYSQFIESRSQVLKDLVDRSCTGEPM